MEIDKEGILQKIATYEQASARLANESVGHAGAAEGLRILLQELEEKELASKIEGDPQEEE